MRGRVRILLKLITVITCLLFLNVSTVQSAAPTITSQQNNWLNLRIELIQSIQRGINNLGVRSAIRPEWILGLVYRETVNFKFSNTTKSNPSLITDDVYSAFYFNDSLGYEKLNTEESHFYNGRVIKGKGTLVVPEIIEEGIKSNLVSFNLPATMVAETAELNKYLMGTIQSQAEIFHSNQFIQLNQSNQSIIRFLYSYILYIRGRAEVSEYRELNSIKTIATNRSVVLDRLLADENNIFWDNKLGVPIGNLEIFRDQIERQYNLKLPSDSLTLKGLYYINIGRLAFSNLTISNTVLASRSSNNRAVGNNNLAERVKTFNGEESTFFLHDIGIRWYYQSHIYTPFSRAWGNLQMNGVTNRVTPFSAEGGRFRATMGSGGCGIYTVAMIASNILDKDITPDIVLKEALRLRVVSISLSDSGVDALFRNLGLRVARVRFSNTEAFRQRVKTTVRNGGMVMYVSRATCGTFPWYFGRGHFMAIRAITPNNRLLTLSSIGTDNFRGKQLTPSEVMNIPLDFSTWLRFMSPNRNFVWLVNKR